MEAQNTIREKFNEQIKKAQQEIEELSLQFSLGKAEAKDKFEDMKKDLSKSIIQWKEKYSVDKKSNQLKKMLEELEMQLSLGKAEAYDKFDEQRKLILAKIGELESEFKSDPQVKEFAESIRNDMEKFKLKMEILQLKFQAKKFDFQSNLKDEMNKASLNVNTLFDEKMKKAKSAVSDFSDEMDATYEHLKKAIQSFGK